MNERTLQFGPSRELVGTLCAPASGAGPASGTTTGLLLLNAGIVHRIGPHRINVRLAREAATRGIPSLRFDLAGRGDSSPAAPGLSYDEQAVADIGQAVATLCRYGRCDRVMLFGICSGADDGLSAAMVEHRIVSLVMFDPPIYPDLRWRARAYAGKLRKFGLRGGLERLLAIRRTLAGVDVGDGDNYGRDVPPLPVYAARLLELVNRGVGVRLVYSGSSCDDTDFRTQCRRVLGHAGLAGRMETEFLPDVDHVVSTRESQEILVARMHAWMDRLRQDHVADARGQ
ncbi:MAG: hypothetical protein M9951_06305 [Burkholderiaceae bacterium]|jgi:hypothetical protein|nr:hypothetical protein [Burkholderiaceae bacterium]